MANKAMYPHTPKRKGPLYPHVTRNQKSGKDRSLTEQRAYEFGAISVWGEYPQWAEFNDDEQAENFADWLRDEGYEAQVLSSRGQFAVRYSIVPRTLLAKTEGDPISKYCCSQCGECAPEELLEEGRFLDRISWLRRHYEERHPGMWGEMSPMTVEDGELVPLQYHHLADLVSEPLPKDAY